MKPNPSRWKSGGATTTGSLARKGSWEKALTTMSTGGVSVARCGTFRQPGRS